MKSKFITYKLIIFFFVAMFVSFVSLAQEKKFPQANQPNKLPAQVKPPVIKSETVSHVGINPIASETVSMSPDQLYLSQGAFLIRTIRDYRYLTEKNDLSKSSIVFQYNQNDLNHQLWNLVQKPEGYYKIRSGTGLYLEMYGTIGIPYNILSRAEANTDKQLWQLEKADNGNYFIKAKSGEYLGVYGSQVNNNTGTSLNNTRDNSTFQKWQLIKMTGDNRVVTSFDPFSQGFHFINTFSGEDFIRWGGLCGGMVYAALDYFTHGMPIPQQSYTPANATPLQSYIYARQQHSMWNVNSKWSELEVAYNTRAGEIFRWGIQGFGGGRLEELENAIIVNRAVPLGLFGGGVPSINGGSGGNHVVLATGYAPGRYKGDFTGHPEDIKIFVYNPNIRNSTTTIVPNMAGQCFFEVETGTVWRTYFVNMQHDKEHVPPGDIPNFPEGEPEGNIRHLYATFKTGGDDLRGGNDNVSIDILYRDGTSQHFGNVNGLARWVDNSTQTVHLELDRPVRKSDILHFAITTTFGDDYFSDDWNLDGFHVTSGAGGIVFASQSTTPGSYIFRFSGNEHRQTFRVPVR
jgi:hypothetical protein